MDIFKELNLDESTILELREKVWRSSSKDTGGEGARNGYRLSQHDWDIMCDISDKIWYSEMDIKTKIKLGLEFYDLLPDYYHGLNPIYDLFRDNKIEDKEKRQEIFDKFSYYLSSDKKYYVNTIGYILWVEFFEAGGLVAQEAWNSIVNSDFLTVTGIKNLLEFSGPAPYSQKELIYRKLLPNKEFHECIFKSLLYSGFDLYGKIEKESAKMILRELGNDYTERIDARFLLEKLNLR